MKKKYFYIITLLIISFNSYSQATFELIMERSNQGGSNYTLVTSNNGPIYLPSNDNLLLLTGWAVDISVTAIEEGDYFLKIDDEPPYPWQLYFNNYLDNTSRTVSFSVNDTKVFSMGIYNTSDTSYPSKKVIIELRKKDFGGVTSSLVQTRNIQLITDADLPTSKVDNLSSTQTDASFEVKWSGSDGVDGTPTISGLREFDVQYKENNGDWEDWYQGTGLPSGTFTGTTGRSYSFRSRAYDNVGNVEIYPDDNGDTQTYINSYGALNVLITPSGAVSSGAQWNVDGGPWRDSETVAYDLLIGDHTINFNNILGWTSPASKTVSIYKGQTIPSDGTYIQQFGSLNVILSPSEAVSFGAQWNVDGGPWRGSGTTESNLSVGVHTINFNNVSGWTAPVSKTVTINENKTTNTNETYIQQFGSLNVTLYPSEAVTAGARWNVDGGAWRGSGTTASNLSVGTHTVNYESIPGWSEPSGKSVNITANETTTEIGTYTQEFGLLSVTIYPSDAITEGAKWNIDGGPWRDSGYTQPNIPVGTHTVYFSDITGWSTPGSKNVTINFNETTNELETYIQEIGSLRVDLTPSTAVTEGAKWNIDGGPWRDSGYTQTNIPVGTHTVYFSDITGWSTPGSKNVTINFHNTTNELGTYTQEFGLLSVMINPSEAVTAGARWNVDGGAWRDSGTTASNLSVGTHTVNYESISGWSEPSGKSVNITANETTTEIGTYTQEFGLLSVTIYPSEAVTAGARWNVNGGPWRESGTIEPNLSVGVHTINFNNVSGWSAPESKTVNINENITTNASGTYTLQQETTTIPDSNFENYLETHDANGNMVSIGDPASMGDGISGNNLVLTSNISGIVELDVRGLSISSLEGIEGFSSLEKLNCSLNDLTILNIDKNLKLKELYCQENQLIGIDISKNILLIELVIGDNLLTTLKVEKNLALQHLSCYRNQLTSLDISKNAELTFLGCFYNQINDIILSNNPVLTWLNISNNNLSNLNVSSLISLTSLYCNQNNLTDLNLLSNPELFALDFTDNQLTNVDIGPKNNLKQIEGHNNPLTSLNLSDNIALVNLWISDNMLSNLNLDNTPNLTDLRVANNKIISLDVSQNSKLEIFYLKNNLLTSLNIKSGNNAILTYFDVTNNPSLACIEVDNASYSSANWLKIDSQTSFSEDCGYQSSQTNIVSYSFDEQTAAITPDNVNHTVDIEVVSGTDITNLISTFELSEGARATINGVDQVSGTTSNDFSNQVIYTIIAEDGSTSQDWYVTAIEETIELTEIPDANFENYLETHDTDGNVVIIGDLTSMGDGIAENNYVLTGRINSVISLDVSNQNIQYLNGIEAFVALKFLNANSNSITGIETNTNTELEELHLSSNNSLQHIDLSENIKLKKLIVNNNNLSDLDVSLLSQLEVLTCHANNLRILDVSNNSNLIELICTFNEIVNLDLSNNLNLTQIYCSYNNLTQLNLSNLNLSQINWRFSAENNPNLECVQVDWSYLGYAELHWTDNVDSQTSFNSDCNFNEIVVMPDSNFEQALINEGIDSEAIANGYVLLTDIIGITSLNLENYNITNLDGIQAFSALEILNVTNNNITDLNISNNSNLTTVNVNNNRLVTLNIKNGNNINITNFSSLGNVNLFCIQVDDAAWSETNWPNIDSHSTFNVDCPNLGAYVNIPDNHFEQKLINDGVDSFGILDGKIYLRDSQRITSLYLNEMNISDLSGIEGFTSLTSLWCFDNFISELDVSHNVLLENLFANNNQLSEILFPVNSSLSKLNISNNKLNIIDLSMLPNLTELDVVSNNLNNINISNNLGISRLFVGDNNLTELSLNNHTLLESLSCGDNEIEILDLNDNNNLIFLQANTNNLSILKLRNGNNSNFQHLVHFQVMNNPNLYCIEVDDADWSTATWIIIDSQTSFSEDCGYQSSQANIVYYSFDEQTTAITPDNVNHTVDIEVVSGTDITNLIPTFELSEGATVTVNSEEQISETTSNDFTNPVTYIVTAEDGTTTKDWRITINLANNNAPTFSSAPITEVNENETYNYIITTTDIDGDGIIVTAPTLPNWLSLSSNIDVTTLAGSTQGYGNGTGEEAHFYYPNGVAIDQFGNVYVSDQWMNVIRKITPEGEVTTFAGSTISGDVDGTGSAARFNNPHDVAIDAAGNVYVADTNNHKIKKITPEGVVTTLAGSIWGHEDGTGSSASFAYPTGISVDDSGYIYVADYENNLIRKITPLGLVTTLAGAGSTNHGSIDGVGSAAQFYHPNDVALDKSGNIYVADSGNDKIRKITPEGVVTTFAGSTPGFADSNGTTAQFHSPMGISIDFAENIYIADYGNHKIRKITPSGMVSTLAGSSSGFADGTLTSAQFNYPSDVTVDALGNVFVADTWNFKIRKITPLGGYILSGNASAQAGEHPVVLNANDGNGGSTDQSFTITVNSSLSSIVLTPKIFLQGPSLSPVTPGLMNDYLRQENNLLTTSPYSDALTVDATVFNTGGSSGNGLVQDDIVDWVWVELRDANDNSVVVKGSSALVQRDGDVVALDGTSNLTIDAVAGNYYVAVNHRNHLGIMSATPISLSSANTIIDFTSDYNLVLGGTNAVVDIGNGILAEYGGDYDENGQTQNTDLTAIIQLLGKSGYSNADLNLNNQIQNTDINDISIPNLGKGQQFTNASTSNKLYAKDKNETDNRNVNYTFENGKNTTENGKYYYEVDVLIESSLAFKLGSGQLFFNYNTAAFGENISSNRKLEFTQPVNYILGEVYGFPAYRDFIQNDNSPSRFSISYRQGVSSTSITENNIIVTPKRLFHLKLEYLDVNQTPEISFETEDLFLDQTFTACGSSSAGFPDCINYSGIQLVNDTFDNTILNVENNQLENSLLIYPNPVLNILTIDSNIPLSKVEIYSVLGKKVKEINTDFKSISISNLSNGMYFLRIYSDKAYTVKKIIKK